MQTLELALTSEEIRSKLKDLHKEYRAKRLELEKMLNDNKDGFTFYYHSKPEHDPLRKGKRMTVCGIVSNGNLSIGVAKLNNKDIFVKAEGREEAHKKATETPIMSIEVKPGKTRAQFMKIVNELLKDIRSEKELTLFAPKIIIKS